LTLGLVVALAACTSMPTSPQAEGKIAMNVEQIKEALVGEWVSIAPELRPSASKNPDGTLKPFYLKRESKYLGGDRFELTIVNTADPNGAVPLARIFIRGHMLWRGPHPIAPEREGRFRRRRGLRRDAAEPGLRRSPEQVAGRLRHVGSGCRAGIFGKSFAPFGIVEARLHGVRPGVPEPRHAVLGRSASTVAASTRKNRPTNLQIPLVHKQRLGPKQGSTRASAVGQEAMGPGLRDSDAAAFSISAATACGCET
jgi:hypothetical protein